MKAHDGGPAFPRPFSGAIGEHNEAQEGMSLRDYFAAHALAGILVNPIPDYVDPDAVASDAYAIADAMVVERLQDGDMVP